MNPIFDLRLCKLHTKILLLRCVSRADLKQRVCALGVLEFLIKTWLPMILRGLLYFEQLHDEIQLSIPNFTNTCQLCPARLNKRDKQWKFPRQWATTKRLPCPVPMSLLTSFASFRYDPATCLCKEDVQSWSSRHLKIMVIYAWLRCFWWKHVDKQQCSKEFNIILFDIQSKLGKGIALITHALILEFW